MCDGLPSWVAIARSLRAEAGHAWPLGYGDRTASEGSEFGTARCKGPVAQWIRRRPTAPAIAGSSHDLSRIELEKKFKQANQ